MTIIWTGPLIRELAHDPFRFVLGRPKEGGFGYPQQVWRYRGAEAYHASGRDPVALERSLTDALEGGCGPTPWKRREIDGVRGALIGTYLPLDAELGGEPSDGPFEPRPEPVVWRGHHLALVQGLPFSTLEGRVQRLIWTERKNLFGRRGTTMLIAATLAYAEVVGERLAGIQVFQLREREVRFFSGSDLRLMWPRLDQLLGWAEGRRAAPPAA